MLIQGVSVSRNSYVTVYEQVFPQYVATSPPPPPPPPPACPADVVLSANTRATGETHADGTVTTFCYPCTPGASLVWCLSNGGDYLGSASIQHSSSTGGAGFGGTAGCFDAGFYGTQPVCPGGGYYQISLSRSGGGNPIAYGVTVFNGTTCTSCTTVPPPPPPPPIGCENYTWDGGTRTVARVDTTSWDGDGSLYTDGSNNWYLYDYNTACTYTLTGDADGAGVYVTDDAGCDPSNKTLVCS